MIYLGITTAEGCVTNTQVTRSGGEFPLCRCAECTGKIYEGGRSGLEIYDALEEVGWASGGSKLNYFETEAQQLEY